MKTYVSDYRVVEPLPSGDFAFAGDSAAERRLIFHVVEDLARPVQVLDIGFGRGTLGALVKANPMTRHWQVDGVDGFAVACWNAPLFKQCYYRNIWHGLAQDLPAAQLVRYDILCLFDVIEHLDVAAACGLLRHLLAALGEGDRLLISTPLWFYPQHSHQPGDLEEHLIGVPASSMLALQPLAYAVSPSLVGTFAYGRESLAHADRFQPVTDRSFSLEQGLRDARAAGLQLAPDTVYKMAPA